MEEGLDVGDCDLVIRFSGHNSLTRHLQTKGRARKREAGRVIVLIDPKEREINQKLDIQEALMTQLIKAEASPILDSTKDIVMKLGKEPDLQELTLQRRHEELFPEHAIRVKDLVLHIYVEGIKSKKSNISRFEKALIQSLNAVSPLCVIDQVVYLDGDAAQISGCDHLFTENSAAFLLGFEKNEDIGIQEDILSQILSDWNRKVEGYPEVGLFLFVPRIKTEKKNADALLRPSAGRKVLHATMVASGDLISKEGVRLRIIYSEAAVNPSEVEMRDDRIKIFLDSDLEMTVPTVSTFGYGIISKKETSNDKFLVAIPLRGNPTVRKYTDDGKCSRITANHLEKNGFLSSFSVGCAASFLTSFTGSSLLILEIKCENILNVVGCLPLKMFHLNFSICASQEAGAEITKTRTMMKSKQEFELLWSLKCLQDSKPLQDFDTFANEVANKPAARNPPLESKLIPALVLLQSEAGLFTELSQRYEEILKHPESIPEKSTYSDTSSHAQKRLIITPSRTVALPDVEMFQSRLSKKFPSLELIIVSFRDENLDKIKDIESIRCLSKFLKDGFQVCGRQFHYLTSSGSQLREHKGVFAQVISVEEIRRIRESIADPAKFNCIAKYMSRLGLYSSTGKFVGQVDLDKQIEYVDDIPARNGSLLTDGCGKIKKAFAKVHDSEMRPNCSAIQFRLAGAKGVLTVVPDDDEDFRSEQTGIILRKSMVKFESKDQDLLVVMHSKYMPVTLNREAINLLDSLARYRNSSIDAILSKLQTEALRELSHRLQYPANARGSLCNYISGDEVSLVAETFDLTSEPYWFSLLLHSYHLECQGIRTKARIPIRNGCRLMGVSDPTNTLLDNEVFLFIQDEQSDFQGIFEGRVLIYRNPCLHPGDLRVVNAVSKPALQAAGLRNVLVFPSVPQCETSLAQECSGGDLDGDQYSIIWDERLVPSASFPPLRYADVASKGEPKSWLGTDLNDPNTVAEYFEENMKNDCLGRVANMHLALCDMLNNGACDEIALRLAESQSVAVDFPKTGILPKVPQAAIGKVVDKGYPDFMREDGYPSNKVLGGLFRQATSFNFQVDMKMEVMQMIDHSLLLNGRQRFTKEAALIYKQYCNDVVILMQKFGLKTEVEAVLGEPLLWDPFFKAEQGKTSEQIRAAWKLLQKKYLDLFLLGLKTSEESLLKASAWYDMAYQQKRNRKQFLSFPWLLYRQLREIRVKAGIEQPIANGLDRAVGRKAIKYHWTTIDSQEKQNEKFYYALTTLKDCLEPEGFNLSVYGSGSIFLGGEQSDLDISCSFNDGRLILDHEKEFLLGSKVRPRIEEVVEQCTAATGGAHPVIHCKVSSGWDCVDSDISMSNTAGLAKTAYIQMIYKKSESTLVAFRCIVQWARCCQILKAFPNDTSLLDTADFYAFMLKNLEAKLPMVNMTKQDGHHYTAPFELWDQLLERIPKTTTPSPEFCLEVGALIVAFFRNVMALPEKHTVEYTWQSDCGDIPKATISPDVVESIKSFVKKSFNVLLVTRDFSQVMDHILDDSKETEIVKRLSAHLRANVSRSLNFFEEKLRLASGVKYLSLQDDPVECSLILRATGTRSCLLKLSKELSTMSGMKTLKHQVNSNKYFMDNASIIHLHRGDPHDRVKFVTYDGSSSGFHSLKELGQIRRLNTSGFMLKDCFWRRTTFDMTQKFRQQLRSLNSISTGDDNQQNLELTTRYVVPFSHIIVSIPGEPEMMRKS